MKSNKKQEPQAQPAVTDPPGAPAAPKPVRNVSLESAVNSNFDAVISKAFPTEYADETDQAILRAVWWAATRHAAVHLVENVCKPLASTAKQQCQANGVEVI